MIYGKLGILSASVGLTSADVLPRLASHKKIYVGGVANSAYVAALLTALVMIGLAHPFSQSHASPTDVCPTVQTTQAYGVQLYFQCRSPWWSSPSEACTLTTFTVAPCYDFNASGKIDVEDVQAIVNRWHEDVGLPYDCDGDGVITVRDIMCAVARWGRDCPQTLGS